jgi:hypothetical protein
MLTDTSIRNAKPAEKPFKLADGELFLLVLTSLNRSRRRPSRAAHMTLGGNDGDFTR